jgi:hypothetical protein
VSERGGGPAPDFSTSFWKEFRLRYPRPAVYIPVGVTYLLFFAMMGVSFHKWERWSLTILALAAVVLSCTAALVAARQFRSRAWLLGLRAALGKDGRGPASRPERPPLASIVLRLCVPFWLALLALGPLFIGGLALSYAGAFWTGGLIGIAWLVVCAWGVPVAVVFGAHAVLAFPGLSAALAGWSSALLLSAVRGVVLITLYGLFGPAELDVDQGACWLILAAGDFLLATLLLPLVFKGAAGALQLRMQEAVSLRLGDEESIDDEPEGTGLGITFWAMLRWRFWRDPLYRAEVRHIWNWRRLVVFWAVAGVWAAGALALLWLMRAERSLLLLQVGIQLPASLPLLAAPGLMAAGLAADRQKGIFETLLLTPVAPLRLAGARLVARYRPLVLVTVVLGIAGAFLFWMKLTPDHPVYGGTGLFRPARSFYRGWLRVGSSWYWILVLLIITGEVFGVAAFGAVGLRFAARYRSVLAALAVTYTVALAWLVCSEMVWTLGVAQYFRYRGSAIGFAAASVLRIVLYGVMARVFLMGAARQMVLKRAE